MIAPTVHIFFFALKKLYMLSKAQDAVLNMGFPRIERLVSLSHKFRQLKRNKRLPHGT